MAKKLLVEDIEIFPCKLFYNDITTTPDGFTDVTSDLSAWDVHCIGAKMESGSVVDYKIMRDNFQAPLFSSLNPNFSNWGTVSATVRQLASKYFYAPYSLRLTQHSEEYDLEQFTRLYQETKGINKLELQGRPRILEEIWELVACKYYRKELISQADSTDFTQSTKEYVFNYLNYSSNELRKWINNESEFASNGFAEKSYFNATMRDEITNIYNGNY